MDRATRNKGGEHKYNVITTHVKCTLGPNGEHPVTVVLARSGALSYVSAPCCKGVDILMDSAQRMGETTFCTGAVDALMKCATANDAYSHRLPEPIQSGLLKFAADKLINHRRRVRGDRHTYELEKVKRRYNHAKLLTVVAKKFSGIDARVQCTTKRNEAGEMKIQKGLYNMRVQGSEQIVATRSKNGVWSLAETFIIVSAARKCGRKGKHCEICGRNYASPSVHMKSAKHTALFKMRVVTAVRELNRRHALVRNW